MRPRGESISVPSTRYIGHEFRHSPQWMQVEYSSHPGRSFVAAEIVESALTPKTFPGSKYFSDPWLASQHACMQDRTRAIPTRRSVAWLQLGTSARSPSHPAAVRRVTTKPRLHTASRMADRLTAAPSPQKAKLNLRARRTREAGYCRARLIQSPQSSLLCHSTSCSPAAALSCDSTQARDRRIPQSTPTAWIRLRHQSSASLLNRVLCCIARAPRHFPPLATRPASASPVEPAMWANNDRDRAQQQPQDSDIPMPAAMRSQDKAARVVSARCDRASTVHPRCWRIASRTSASAWAADKRASSPR